MLFSPSCVLYFLLFFALTISTHSLFPCMSLSPTLVLYICVFPSSKVLAHWLPVMKEHQEPIERPILRAVIGWHHRHIDTVCLSTFFWGVGGVGGGAWAETEKILQIIVGCRVKLSPLKLGVCERSSVCMWVSMYVCTLVRVLCASLTHPQTFPFTHTHTHPSPPTPHLYVKCQSWRMDPV